MAGRARGFPRFGHEPQIRRIGHGRGRPFAPEGPLLVLVGQPFVVFGSLATFVGLNHQLLETAVAPQNVREQSEKCRRQQSRQAR